jgi:endoglycosylceramidase
MLLLPLLLLLVARAAGSIHVEPNGARSFFVDEKNRTRFFHGVNVVFKEPPFLPRTDRFDASDSLCAQDIANLVEWGFNVVRLGVMWQAAEPVEGQINQTFFAETVKLVNTLGASGIFTLVDQHQDLLSRFYCGEGFPDWAVNASAQFPAPLSFTPYKTDPATHYPDLQQCLSLMFGDYYAAFATADAFQALYDNRNRLQDKFARFWGTVAQQFAGNRFVLGYELINEPFLGDVWKHPSLVFTTETDSRYLMPMYDRLAASIRRFDDDHIVFFEKATGNYFVPEACGFNAPPLGADYANRSVYSYHQYCGPSDANGTPRSLFWCETEDQLWSGQAHADAARLNVVGMLTEFGASINSTNADYMLGFLADEVDRALQGGWIYWEFKTFDDITTSGPGVESFYDANGDLELNKVAALSRTYATAVAGRPTKMRFDTKTKQFDLQYTYNPGTTGNTEIYLNERVHYGGGFGVTISPPAAATWTRVQRNRLEITHTSAFGPSSPQLSIRITAN